MYPTSDPIANATRSAASQAASDARAAQDKVEHLQREVDRLYLITESLWELLKKEHGYEEKVLADLMTQLDMKDGTLNGRPAKTEAKPCPKCGRPITKHRLTCMYCGAPVTLEPFAR